MPTLKKKEYASFPLLHLPLLALEVVVCQIDSFQSVILSMMCEKYRRVLNVTKIRTGDLSFQFCDREANVLLLFETHYNIITSCVPIRNQQLIMRINGVPTKIDLKLSAGFSDSKTVTIMTPDNQDETVTKTLENLTEHLFGFLAPNDIYLNFTRPIGMRECFVWRYFQRFKAVRAGSYASRVFPEELSLLLDTVNTVYLGLQHKSIDEKISEVLQSWIDGKQLKMEELSFSTSMHTEQFLELCGQLNATASEFTVQELQDRTDCVSIVNIQGVVSRDIRRHCDGQIATITHSSDTSLYHKIVVFFWTDTLLEATGRI
ncbi:unnamed protein product [Caenorhabditis brenneri]